MDQAFHEYQEVTQLAKGAAGSRYRARASNDDVIIQVYEFVYLSSTQEQERFQQECKQLQRLRHPFISQLQDAGIEQDHPYLVNKAISDDSLRSRLSSARIPLGKALSIIIRTGQALSYAHTWNILHTNIRPENILFKARDQVILADFLPRSITESWLDPQNACYVAPEQFSGLYSTSSDQYALGCVAYELFTGQPPFTATDLSMSQAMHSKERPKPLTSLVPDLPKHINDAVLKALAKKPAERHASISDFLAALTARSAPATVDLSSAEVPQEPFPEETPDEEPTDLFPIFQQDQVAKKETESFFDLPLNEPAVEHHPQEVLPNDAPAFSEPPNIPSPSAANRGHVPEPTPSAARRPATSGHKKTS
ncbi:MAG: protein kinase, partial [Ktedonobacteraceae bacterium]|nr:protein kinase [Ktedonobacteraceae bacterium]